MSRVTKKDVYFYLDMCNRRLKTLNVDMQLRLSSAYGDYRIIDTNYNDISKRGNLRSMYDQLYMLSKVLESMKASE